MPIRALPPRIVTVHPVPPPPSRFRALLRHGSLPHIVGIAVYSAGVVALCVTVDNAVHGTGDQHVDAAAAASIPVVRVQVTTPRQRPATTAPTTTTMPPPKPVVAPAIPQPAPARVDIADADARKVVDFALAQLGVPYVWGGAGRSGYDCSGLVMRAWQTVGIDLPHEARLQARAGIRITRSELMPGDLVISNHYGHVALYIGGGRIIQAPHTGAVVSIAPLPRSGVDAYVRVDPGA
jgi:cell wall-associated NlpC family hydrolase